MAPPASTASTSAKPNIDDNDHFGQIACVGFSSKMMDSLTHEIGETGWG
jgi:hypothetical protein